MVCANVPAWLICFETMGRFRQHLRLFSAAWIVFQVTSLSTLVPRACCLAHQSSAAKPAGCHEDAAVPNPTSPADETTPGTMHHGHGQMHEQAAPSSSTPTHDCVLRGTCGGPTAALLALLSTHGVLTESVASPTDFPLAGNAPSAAAQLIRQFESPDAPPPRA